MIEKIGDISDGIRKVMNGNYRFTRLRKPDTKEICSVKERDQDIYAGSVRNDSYKSYLDNLATMRKMAWQQIPEPKLHPDPEQTEEQIRNYAAEMYDSAEKGNAAQESFEVLTEFREEVEVIVESGDERVCDNLEVLEDSWGKMEDLTEENWSRYNSYLEAELESRIQFLQNMQSGFSEGGDETV